MPQPDAAQQAQEMAMRAHLADRIEAAGGWLRFDAWLQELLYAPAFGYYSGGSTKFGAAGDFITAPELSPLFGHCLARAIAPVLAGLGPGAVLLEPGAGSGALALQLLERLAQLDALPAEYLVLEVSADLRDRQQQRLAQLPAELRTRVRWLDALPAAPLTGMVVANEVLDALPFRCFERGADEAWLERGVAIEDGAPGWSVRAADAAAATELDALCRDAGLDPPAGYRLELCARADAWVAAFAGVIGRGALLLFDYGAGRGELYHAQRGVGTLRCHYRHRAHDDPFLHPGLQDVTAWVDFTRVAAAGADAGCAVAGYCTQAAFLAASGMDEELRMARDAREQAQLASAARQLLLPGEMGESFKGIALTRGVDWTGGGFALQDLRRTL
jgi:SAM-dependent MidA family methyltransferase